MRIPVYRSRATATSEAPGRSIGARMRGDILAQAELQKGKVVSEAINQVGAYASMRYKVAEETKLNEGLLAATEGLAMSSRDLLNSGKLYNVLDGNNPLWSQQSESIRNKVLDALGPNRFTRKAFEERFGQMELNERLKLRGTLDRKIDAANQAALASRQNGIVADLSSPGASIEEYKEKVLGLTVDQGRLVKSGMANPNIVKLGNTKMQKKIAENVVGAYIGGSPNAALSLMDALEQMEEGSIDPEKAANLPGGAYPLYTLQNLPKDVAIDVLDDALKVASRFSAAAQKLEKRRDAEADNIAEAALNRFAYFTGAFEPGETIKASEVTNYFPSLAETFPDPNALIYPNAAAEAMKGILYSLNAVTPAMQETFDKSEDNLFAGSYPKNSSRTVYDDLFRLKEKGDLTTADVDASKSLLTKSDIKFFYDAIETEEEEAATQFKRRAKAQFQYSELTALDTDEAQSSRAAYFSVVQSLEEEIIARRLSDEGPMSPREINTLGKTLLDEQQEIFAIELRGSYLEYIERVNTKQSGNSLVLDPKDPIGSLDAWWATTDQSQQRTTYSRTKKTLMREYINKGVLN